MEQIGTSTIWCEKFRPKVINDLIIPDNYKKLFLKFVEDKDIPNLIFSSSAGRGKTTTGYALCYEIGSDLLYINGSMETSIDTLRYKVQQYAMTHSFNDCKKVVLIDEAERISLNGQDAIKGLIEQAESTCRFIFTTNNISKLIDPVKSRCQIVDFNFNVSETKKMVVAYYKRICWILEQENVKYDKKVLAEFVQKMYPDFRKTINELQKFVKMYGEVSEAIFQNLDGTQFTSLVEEIKNKKYNSMRKIISNMDSDVFYQTFYDQIEDLLEPTCMPEIVMILGRYCYESSLSVSKEVTLSSCCTEIMKSAKFK